MSEGEVEQLADLTPAPGPGSGGLAEWIRSPAFWLGLAALGLTCWIYSPLFFPATPQGLATQSEEFFFEANEAAGAPVLILSLWLFYRRSHWRDVLLGDGAPAAGLTVLALTAALFGWGVFTGASDLQLASVLPLLVGAALCMGGVAAVRAFWVPILFLAFALPLPPVPLAALMFPIQLLTAEYAGVILNSIGVASFVQGDQILRPENTFIVIETCSGVRTIVTLSMLTVLLIDLFERHGWHAVILMIAAPCVAFITNGFRVVTLVLNPHSSIHSIHNLQGIGMLLVGLTAMYLLDLALERIFGEGYDPSGESVQRDVRTAAASVGSRSKRLAGIVSVLVAMAIASSAMTPWKVQGGLAEMPAALLDRVFGEIQTREIPPDFQFRGSARFLAHSTRRIRLDGEQMEIFLAVGNEQLRSHTALTPRVAWPESGYAVVEEETTELGPSGPTARRMVLRSGARSLLSYSWYVRNGSFANEWWRQAVALDRSPYVRQKHMLVLRISTPLGAGGTGVVAAEARVQKAWQRLAPELDDYAPTQVRP